MAGPWQKGKKLIISLAGPWQNEKKKKILIYFVKKREKTRIFFGRTLAAKKRSRRSRLVLSSWRRTFTIRLFVKQY